MKFKMHSRRLRVWGAALPPLMTALVSFSFVSLAFGAAVYVAAVPALIVQEHPAQGAGGDGSAQRPNAAGGDSSLAAGSGEASGADAGSGAAGGEAADGSAAGGGAGDAGASGGSITFPFLEIPAMPVGGGASGDGSAGSQSPAGPSDPQGGGAGDAGQDGGQGGSVADPPAQEEPETGVPEETEQQYHAALVQAYDQLGTLAPQVSQAYGNLVQLGLEPSVDARMGYFGDYIALRDVVDIALMGLSDLHLPAESRHYASWQEIQTLYSDLSNTMHILVRCWLINVQFEDPAAHVDDFTGPVSENSQGGKLTYLRDFESRYPGARP